MDTRELGVLGEKLACGYLVEKGFNILGKNYRVTFGEIDIVAQKGEVIHFVEVKTVVANDGFYPEEHVNYKKQRKLRQMAEIWLAKNHPSTGSGQEIPYQIDVIGITANEATRQAKLHYFPNAVGG